METAKRTESNLQLRNKLNDCASEYNSGVITGMDELLIPSLIEVFDIKTDLVVIYVYIDNVDLRRQTNCDTH